MKVEEIYAGAFVRELPAIPHDLAAGLFVHALMCLEFDDHYGDCLLCDSMGLCGRGSELQETAYLYRDTLRGKIKAYEESLT